MSPPRRTTARQGGRPQAAQRFLRGSGSLQETLDRRLVAAVSCRPRLTLRRPFFLEDQKLKITLQIVGEVCVLRLEGKFIVGGESIYLKDKVKDVLNMGMKSILVDLGKVPYVDSTGIGFLVSSHTAVKSQGGALKLLSPNFRVREVLRITKLDKIFEIFDKEEEAIASFSAPPKKASSRKQSASKESEE